MWHHCNSVVWICPEQSEQVHYTNIVFCVQCIFIFCSRDIFFLTFQQVDVKKATPKPDGIGGIRGGSRGGRGGRGRGRGGRDTRVKGKGEQAGVPWKTNCCTIPCKCFKFIHIFLCKCV